MTRVRWLWHLALGRWGWQGPAGAGLVLASALFAAAVLLPMDDHLEQVRSSLANARKAEGAGMKTPVATDPAADLDAFYRSFPADEALTDLLAKLHRIGDAHGLALQQADYHAVEDGGRRLGQYRISIPVPATYPQLKAFLAEALGDMPNLSLDQLSVQKRAVGEATVEVQMQFTLYLRQRT